MRTRALTSLASLVHIVLAVFCALPLYALAKAARSIMHRGGPGKARVAGREPSS